MPEGSPNGLKHPEHSLPWMRPESMYRLLDVGIEQCDPSTLYFGVDPVYRQYRAEARFQRLIKRVGQPPHPAGGEELD
jgi:hypothetical protein